MVWWTWASIGLVLLAAEVFIAGGYVILFFGLSGLAMAFVSASGFLPDFNHQLLLFSLLSVLFLLLLRRPLVARQKVNMASLNMDKIVGEHGKALETIAPGGAGKVELRGSGWSSKNVGSAELKEGEAVTVMKVEGLTLFVSKR